VLNAAGGQPRGGDANLYALHDTAIKSLSDYGIAIVDDMDLASAPESLKRSRTLIGQVKGAGEMYNWSVPPEPAMLIKALSDAAALKGGVVIFSSVEDGHLAFVKSPLTITLAEPVAEDYAVVLRSCFGGSAAASIDAGAIFQLHSQLSPADMKAAIARASLQVDAASALVQPGGCHVVVGTSEILAAVRADLMTGAAVAPEEVEAVDLATYPGMEQIKNELERQVLFPLEQPVLAAKLGLAPKRGVLLHGEPGTGKTTVGRWLAHRLKGKFFRVGEMMLHADIIKVFAAAQAAAPSVVFIDDADIVIGGWRPLDGHRGSDIFRFLLGQMDGLTSRGSKQNGDVIVMLTGQNVHWMADMLLRSGRIEFWLKTKLPDARKRREILTKYITEDSGAMELLSKEGNPPDVSTAAQTCDGFCESDLRRVVNDAKMLAAWDLQLADGECQAKPKMMGAKYLEESAKAINRMQDDVKSNVRNMYG
jgi:DNA polymerase III delta prime subunit